MTDGNNPLRRGSLAGEVRLIPSQSLHHEVSEEALAWAAGGRGLTSVRYR
ncbi:MAG: hypothetical protein ACI8RZ_003232 [Myxococcota bacterium]|jgi:hypothetical protein